MALYENGFDKNQINVKTNVSVRNIEIYIKNYEEAKKKKINLKTYNGKKLNVKDLCILQAICYRVNPKYKWVTIG